MNLRGAIVAALTVAVAVLTGCQSSSDAASDESTVILGVATSVAPALRASIDDGGLADSNVDIALTAAASSVIAQQVAQGAPISVVVSADERYVADLERDGFVERRDRLAGNEIVLAVPAASSAVGDVSDLDRSSVTVGVCQRAVPCGEYAATALAFQSVDANIVTEERNVGSLTQKLLAGELDAAIVYATDVAAHPDDLRAVPMSMPPGLDVAVWVGLVAGSGDDAATLYSDVRSADVLADLLAAGFTR